MDRVRAVFSRVSRSAVQLALATIHSPLARTCLRRAMSGSNLKKRRKIDAFPKGTAVRQDNEINKGRERNLAVVSRKGWISWYQLQTDRNFS